MAKGAKEIAGSFVFVGNQPFLDFLNTVPARYGQPVELLHGGARLVQWLEAASLLPPGQGAAFLALSAQEQEKVLQEARQFREAARALLEACRRGGQETESLLQEVNRFLARLGQPILASDEGGFRVSHCADDPGLALLIPILRAGLDFFVSGELSRVRRCDNPSCVLYFLDSTKSGTRRWCRMGACGNVSKARAHRSRLREHAVVAPKRQDADAGRHRSPR